MSENHKSSQSESVNHQAMNSSKKANPYWLSLEQWGGDPEFQEKAEREFITSPLKSEDGEDGVARREFLKLMGASLALSTAGCLRRPVQKIVPYAKQPEEITLGKANYYTSSWSDGLEVFPLLVKSLEGRPIKVEGLAEHPLSKGGLSARAQAHLLMAYDPDRAQAPLRLIQREGRTNFESIGTTWEKLDEVVAAQLKKGQVALLTGVLNSPSTRQLVADFAGAFGAQHVVWDPLAGEDVVKGQELSYGQGVLPQFRFDKAKVIVSLDADFLGSWLTPTVFAAQFAEGRRQVEGMNRLVSFDSVYTLTSANSDERYSIKPSEQLAVVYGLLFEVLKSQAFSGSRFANDEKLKSALATYQGSGLASRLGEAIKKVASDLVAHRGAGLVVAGGLQTATADALSLQVAVNLLNSVLENDGKTILYAQAQRGAKSSRADLEKLLGQMKAGEIKTLIVHGTNPAYYLGEKFTQALAQVEMVLSTSDRLDETSRLANYLVPDNHPLESWSDQEMYDGLVSIQQPTIRPIHDTRSFQFSLINWAYLAERGPARLTEPESFYDYLREYWKAAYFAKSGEASFDVFWSSVLEKGFVGKALSDQAGGLNVRTPSVQALYGAVINESAAAAYELALYATSHQSKGDMANVSWLQELPDPVTKVVWDNFVMVSPSLASQLKLKMGQVLKLKLASGQSLSAPVLVQPGLHSQVLAISVGYGRAFAGKLGSGVGVNAYPLMGLSKDQLQLASGLAVEIEVTGEMQSLACTQDHHSMEGRPIVNETTLGAWQKNKESGIHRHKVFSIWPHHKYDGHKWAMAIDLNTCTGCSACVVACQSENNIPVVGKKYVLQGREMHWIRIDRYYGGDPANPDAVFQPMMCQHCDNAPCETVCPVLATVHSSEGLNEMVYNRCVGTRYCSNNCPYKVRRFNWFNYAKLIEKPMHLALNPEVGVRVRGVMEKCSFCVQRIKAAKDVAKSEARGLKGDEVKTACQQSCPTQAIVFGDVNDPESRVAKIFKSEPRAYTLLEEFNAAPAVRYLTKVRNTDRVLAGGAHHAEGDHAALQGKGTEKEVTL